MLRGLGAAGLALRPRPAVREARGLPTLGGRWLRFARALRGLLQPPYLPGVSLLRELAAHADLESDLPAALRVLEDVAPREGCERLLALDEDVEVRELHAEAAGVVEITEEALALVVGHAHLNRREPIEVLRLQRGAVFLEDIAHRDFLGAALGRPRHSAEDPERAVLGTVGLLRLRLLVAEERVGQELVALQRVVRALSEDRLDDRGLDVNLQAFDQGDADRVLQLDQLILAPAHLFRILEEPGADVRCPNLERHGAVGELDRSRDHLADAEGFCGLDLAQVALLTHEVDLLLRVYAYAADLAEHRVECVAREVSHPGGNVSPAPDLHDSHRHRPVGRGEGHSIGRGPRRRRRFSISWAPLLVPRVQEARGDGGEQDHHDRQAHGKADAAWRRGGTCL